MTWRDSGGGGDFEQPPVGTHAARCVRIIDIGTQKGEYQGQPNFKRQCIIAWELPEEKISTGEYAGQPFMVSKFYTASLNEKSNLRHDLVAWRGREFTTGELDGFDERKVISTGCMISLILNAKGKIKVGSVMALPKGVILPKQFNESLYFSLEKDKFDASIYEKLSKGYKEMIARSPEFQELAGIKQSAPSDDDIPLGEYEKRLGDLDDDIPF